ncbi:hypothetical protein PQX77_007331 [Marasmius sp. AFHP31]|nr:hypothetical protein PQX77_007331 [Marasmius sp. AFHP31]
MPPKRSSAPMSRADLVRNLWAEFESWHSEQLALLDERITKALRELDQNRKPAGGGKKKNKGKDKEKDADHEKKKADTRKELEKSFDGNKVRQEWQKRLDKAGLREYDWHDMTENEQKKVEKILGVDLDPNEGDVTIIETAPPPAQPPASTQRTSPSSLATSPMSNSSRLDVMSEPYAFVDPASFRAAEAVAEEIPFDNWLEVRQRHKSDDEVSLDASTTSSWAGGTDVPAYLAWSSEISRSSAQSSQTSLTGSPERLASKLPVAEPFHSNLVSSAVHRLALFGDGPRDSGVSNIKKPADTTRSEFMPAMHTSFRSTDRTAVDPQMSSSSSTKRSKQRYIGPELLDVDYDESVEAEQFREFKMNVRIEMIREFHQDAAEADIQLALTIEEANYSGAVSKEMTAQLVEEHERKMLRLRQSKEKERKERVEQERQRRLAEFHQRSKQKQKPVSQPQHLPPPAATSHEHSSLPNSGIDPKILTEKFLRELQNGPEAARAPSNAVSDTPTIRSQLNRMRLPNIQDWLAGANNDSGTDTPTPTIQSSGWKFKETPSPTATLADAPSFKRLPSGLAKSVSVDSTSSSQPSEDIPSTEPESSASEFSKTSKGASTSSSKKGAKSKAESTKKKEKAPAAASQTEVAGSSKAKPEQTPPKLQTHGSATKVEKSAAPASKSNAVPSSSTSPTAILPPPPVPRSTRPDIPATPIPLYAFAQPNLDQFPQVFPSSQAPPVSVQPPSQPPSHLHTPAFPPPQSSASSNHLPAPSHLQTPAFQSLQAPPPPSTSQQPPPPSLHVPSLTATDNHQRWVPPTTKSEEKRPQPSRTVTEPPSKIKKSNTTQSTILPPPPAQADSSKRSRRVSDPVMPGSFDYPNAKAPSQVPAQSSAKPNNPPSGILKKVGASTSNGSTKATSKSSGKAKKVTIEEVKDEEEEEEGKFEHLPSDSSHIMEPKPVVAQAMFSPIFDFSGEDELKDRRAVVEKKAQVAAPPPPAPIRRQESETSSASAFAPKSNQIWIPPQSSMAEARSVGSSSSRMPGQFNEGSNSSERHIRWTANTTTIEDDGGERFLHGLDELMKVVEKKESAGAPPPKTDWSQPDMPRMSSMAENGRVGAGRSAASQSGVFWNPKATTHRKPLTTSS